MPENRPGTEARESCESVPSPCIRNCCLNLEDVCIGCGRSLEEIRSWSQLSHVEKQLTLYKSRLRLDQIKKPLI